MIRTSKELVREMFLKYLEKGIFDKNHPEIKRLYKKFFGKDLKNGN